MEIYQLSQEDLIAVIEGAVESAVSRALGKPNIVADIPPMDPLTWADDRLCTRKEAEAYAQATGNPVSKWILDKLAVNGDGPPIEYFDRKPLYRLGAFKSWLTSRTRRVRSTAELRRALRSEAAVA